MICMMLHKSNEAMEEMIVFLRDKHSLMEITEKVLELQNQLPENLKVAR